MVFPLVRRSTRNESPKAFYGILVALALALAALAGPACKSTGKAGFSGSGEGIVMRVVRGDRACYLTLRQGGNPAGYLATFEVCPPALLMLGSRVRYDLGRVPVQSVRCEGNPDCKLTTVETVIVRIRKAPPGT